MGNNSYYSFEDEAVLKRLYHEVEQEIIGVAKLRKIINKKDAELSQKDAINGRLVEELDQKNAELKRLKALLNTNNLS